MGQGVGCLLAGGWPRAPPATLPRPGPDEPQPEMPGPPSQPEAPPPGWRGPWRPGMAAPLQPGQALEPAAPPPPPLPHHYWLSVERGAAEEVMVRKGVLIEV